MWWRFRSGTGTMCRRASLRMGRGARGLLRRRQSCRRSREINCCYCLLYIEMPESFLPDESVAVMCSVRVLPSFDTSTRPLFVSLPFFLLVSSNLCSSIILYERESAVGSPVSGYSLPSNLPVHSVCNGLPLLSVPSVVTFTLSPSFA